MEMTKEEFAKMMDEIKARGLADFDRVAFSMTRGMIVVPDSGPWAEYKPSDRVTAAITIKWPPSGK